MADNVPITAGSGTNIATDDIGGVQYQRVKPSFGADGFAVDVSAANPMPVIIDGGAIYDSLEHIRQGISVLNRRAHLARVDASGRQSVIFDTGSSLGAITSLGTVTTVTGVTTVSTVTTVNTVAAVTALNNFGSVSATSAALAWSRTAYNTGVRSNLSFS
jgi:hypothetical protein